MRSRSPSASRRPSSIPRARRSFPACSSRACCRRRTACSWDCASSACSSGSCSRASIARFPGTTSADGTPLADAHGIAFAFGIDALTFLASIASLLVIRISPLTGKPPERNVLHSIAEGLRGVWRDVSLRSYLMYVSLISLFVGGPVQVGLPLLAESRLHWGAASFGTLMSAYGGGVVIGNALTGSGVISTKGRLGLRLLSIDVFAGLVFAALALVQSTWVGASLLLALGVAAGFAQVAMYSWMQQRVPPERMGRTMSVAMLTFFGVAPLSAAAAGLVLSTRRSRSSSSARG